MRNQIMVTPLCEIDTLIKALAAELAEQQASIPDESSQSEVLAQMEEALFELKVRKMLLAERRPL
jgi:hypothetical protein